jgi:uncharacterized membrane protein
MTTQRSADPSATIPAPRSRQADEPPRSAGRRTALLSGLSLPGAWGALVMTCASLTPSLMPRSGVTQGLVGAVSAVSGYAVGVFAAAVWRGLADRPARPARPWAWRVLAAAALAAGTSFLVLGWRWQAELRALMGAPPQPWWQLLVALPVGAAASAATLLVARLLRAAGRAVARLVGRWTSPRAARVIGGLVIGALAVLLVSGVALDGLLAASDASFAAADAGTPEGARPPTSPLRSGGPGSLLSWGSLGYFGRQFVSGGPSAAQIAALGGPAEEPIRVYAGLAAAGDTETRAHRAVADLDRAGGFQRSRLLVATTTGRGWLDPGTMSAFEYVAGGDSAIVSMQYSYVPSGISYLVDQSRARSAGRSLFDEVYAHWSTLPPASRPQLYVFGESLGSFGAEAAFSGAADLRNRTSGALFVGGPDFNPLDREFRSDRDPGTPEIEPVYRGGRTVRFSTDIARGAPPAAVPWEGPRVLVLQHPSDPISVWSPRLLLRRPDWLAEPRGRDVLPSMTWLPVVTFWQVTLDMPSADTAPEGHGHRYTRESVDAWATVLRPAGWSAARAAQVRALVGG